jgi:peroxiredoxin
MTKSQYNKLVNTFGAEHVTISKDAPKAIKKFAKK